ncbi:uncharacterized protein LOC141897136 isoform X2 [Acropora palmata]|uniref:uncharacterized protein LOC141897136 isoform X2 n=1 Tax=Acropora palmata TaxID=6131 RepID=UPI003DA0E6A4
MEKVEFKSFLLSLSKKLGQSDLDQLKFVLEPFVSHGRSEGLKEAFQYFAELERLGKLAPTDLSLLRTGFKEIGRQDLVDELDERKDYFNQLFHSKSKDHQNGKFDVACDGNDSNSLQTSCSSHGDRGDLGFMKAAKLIGSMKDDDLLVQDSEDGHKESKDIFFPDESAHGPHIDPLVVSNATLPEPRSDEELRAALGSCGINSSEGPGLAQAGQKEPCKSVTCTSPVNTLKQHNQALDNDVSDGVEDEKAESEEPSGNKGEVSSEAQGHQSSPHEYGGARPKHQTFKHPVSSESTFLCPQTQMDQGYGTILSSGTASGKQPIEDECSTSSPFGHIVEDDKSSDGAMATSKCKAYHSTDPQPSGVPSHQNSKSLDTLLSSIPGFNPAQLSLGPENILEVQEILKDLRLWQQLNLANAGQSTQHPTFQDGNFPSTDSTVQPRSYDKGGYSVVISNGTLCHSNKERGIVMMKTGTQFQIAIANNNDFDAEVDITFGGMYLGFWLVEAKRSLQNPLIVEGAAWAEGRLKFFSASDTSAPKAKEEYYGGVPGKNGIVELEFKPEELKPRFCVQHVYGNNSQQEILMPNFETATIGDLKREINKKFSSEVALLMVNGCILEEDKTISSYALKDETIIEVLFTEEPLLIEGPERNQQTMLIEPRKTSIQDVKEFIASKIGIPLDKQRVSYCGKDMCDSNSPSLLHIFITAKAAPVFNVSALIENSEPPKERKLRGFEASRSTGRTFRGFPGSTSCDSGESTRAYFDSRPRASLLRGDHDNDHGNVNTFGELQEGRALLCGDEESVYKQFQEDKRPVKFSKEHAVKMVIQLVSNRSSEPTGRKSTRYPPPVPE